MAASWLSCRRPCSGTFGPFCPLTSRRNLALLKVYHSLQIETASAEQMQHGNIWADLFFGTYDGEFSAAFEHRHACLGSVRPFWRRSSSRSSSDMWASSSASWSTLPSATIRLGLPLTQSLIAAWSRVMKDRSQCKATTVTTAANELPRGAFPVMPRLATDPIVITTVTSRGVARPNERDPEGFFQGFQNSHFCLHDTKEPKPFRRCQKAPSARVCSELTQIVE